MDQNYIVDYYLSAFPAEWISAPYKDVKEVKPKMPMSIGDTFSGAEPFSPPPEGTIVLTVGASTPRVLQRINDAWWAAGEKFPTVLNRHITYKVIFRPLRTGVTVRKGDIEALSVGTVLHSKTTGFKYFRVVDMGWCCAQSSKFRTNKEMSDGGGEYIVVYKP